MKRRSFLQAVGGAIAAMFVPAVAAKTTKFVPTGFRPYHGNGGIVRTGASGRAIFSGDICVWDSGAYRPAMVSDDVNVFGSHVAIAVPNESGGFNFMRYPECMDVVMDIEIRG